MESPSVKDRPAVRLPGEPRSRGRLWLGKSSSEMGLRQRGQARFEFCSKPAGIRKIKARLGATLQFVSVLARL
jgi:hypothetical protein